MDYIKMEYREIGWRGWGICWFDLAQDKEQ
jgi:hypothetical protein